MEADYYKSYVAVSSILVFEGEEMPRSDVGVLTLSVVMLSVFTFVFCIVELDAKIKLYPAIKSVLKKPVKRLLKPLLCDRCFQGQRNLGA